MTDDSNDPDDSPLHFHGPRDWARWLAANHASSRGVWLKISNKTSTSASSAASVSYAEAVLGALAWGWIDGQKKRNDDESWLQRFTPRARRSPWSKINRTKAEELIATRKMKRPGMAEVERAKADGRWTAAYDSPRTSTVPADLARAFAANKPAAAFFDAIDAANRYAILHRVQTAKKPETRAARIAKFVAMLGRRETIHPPRRAT